MKSWVVVTVEGGIVQSDDYYQGDESGVNPILVIDYDYEDNAPEEIAEILDRYEQEALELPEEWDVRHNIITTVNEERKRFGVERGEWLPNKGEQ